MVAIPLYMEVREGLRKGIWRQKLSQNSWRNVAYWLAQLPLLIQPKTKCSRSGTTHSEVGPPESRKCSIAMSTVASLMEVGQQYLRFCLPR